MMNRRLVSVLVGFTLGAAVLGSPGSAAASVDDPLAVTGFQGEWSPTSKIAASAAALTTVGVAAVAITSDGKHVATPSADARTQLKVAHKWDLRGEILITTQPAPVRPGGGFGPVRLRATRTSTTGRAG